MSRCFPFPPPGYEKRALTDVGDLITKEKHKERKHKKDKKEKERKEGKEKKDKEKSREKHREKKEKKEKKEKHKDKDKKDKSKSKDKKEKDRNKQKKESPFEKRVEGPHDVLNGGRHAENSQNGNDIKGSKFVHEFARRIRDENGATESHMVHKISVNNHEKDKIPGREMESCANHFSAENDKHGRKNINRKINGQEVHRNLHGSSVDNYFSPGDQRRLEISTVAVDQKNFENQIEGNWRNKLKKDDNKSSKLMGREPVFATSVDKKNPENRKRKIEIPKEDYNKSDKPMGREQDKRDKEKNKERDKEKENKGKVKQICDSRKVQSGESEGFGNHLQTCTLNPFDMSKDNDDNKSSIGDDILGKRKEIGKNGYIHDKKTRPHKLIKHASSTHLCSENGKFLEPSQNSLQLLAEKPLACSNGKVTIKEKRPNGFIEQQQRNSGTLPNNVQINGNVRASEKQLRHVKPPHPDVKYLNQILTVPSVDDLPEMDNDDQEWLFKDNNKALADESKIYMLGDGSKPVWAEALRFDDADLIALPYVVPY